MVCFKGGKLFIKYIVASYIKKETYNLHDYTRGGKRKHRQLVQQYTI